MVADGCLLMSFTMQITWLASVFLISFAVTVSFFGGPGLSFEQVMKCLTGNLAGLSVPKEKIAFNYLNTQHDSAVRTQVKSLACSKKHTNVDIIVKYQKERCA